MASIILDFVRANNFYEAFNTIWSYTDMTGDASNTPFHMVLASDCGDTFEDNIDSDGCLNEAVTVDTGFKVDVPLDWKEDGVISRDVVISEDVTITIGDDLHDLKGVFFTVDYDVDNETKDYVIAYLILPYYLIVTNEIIFPKDISLVSVE